MNGDEDVLEARMGHGVQQLLARFVDDWAGTCQHADRPQVAAVVETTSQCFECAYGTAAVEAWARGSGCHLCGAATEDLDRLWMVQPIENVVIVVRLCGDCQERETEETEMTMTETECCVDCMDTFVDLTAGKPGASTSELHWACRETLREVSRNIMRDRTGRNDLRTRAVFARGWRAVTR